MQILKVWGATDILHSEQAPGWWQQLSEAHMLQNKGLEYRFSSLFQCWKWKG